MSKLSKIWTKKSKMRKPQILRGLKRVKLRLKRVKWEKILNQVAKKSKMKIKMRNQNEWIFDGPKESKMKMKTTYRV